MHTYSQLQAGGQQPLAIHWSVATNVAYQNRQEASGTVMRDWSPNINGAGCTASNNHWKVSVAARRHTGSMLCL